MNSKHLPLILLLTAFLAAPRVAQAQIPVTDVLHIATTTWAELARYAQGAYDLIQQATQIYNQVKQIENQVKALKKLDYHSWRGIDQLYFQIDDLLHARESLSYALDDIEAQFIETFPGIGYNRFPEEHQSEAYRTLYTFQNNLLALHEIHVESQAAFENLALIEDQIQNAGGTQQALEALGELGSWQADQLASMGTTLETLANASIVAASYETNLKTRLLQTHTETLTSTLYRAEAEAARAKPSYPLLPSWMPR